MSVTRDSGFPVTAHSSADGTGTTTWPAFTTPATNRFVVAMMLGNGSAATAISSFTSSNLTWASRLAVIDVTGAWRVEIYTAFAASVVTSEVISMTHTGSVHYGSRDLLIWSFNGGDVNSAGNTASINNWASAATPQLAVTATGGGSYLLVGVPYRSGGSDLAVDSNSTSEYDEGTGGGFGFTARAVSRTSSTSGSLTLGFTGTPFDLQSLGGIEVKQAAATVPQVPHNTYMVGILTQ
jgi:hypothetical protein